jgi:hypothetical protein
MPVSIVAALPAARGAPIGIRLHTPEPDPPVPPPKEPPLPGPVPEREPPEPRQPPIGDPPPVPIDIPPMHRHAAVPVTNLTQLLPRDYPFGVLDLK